MSRIPSKWEVKSLAGLQEAAGLAFGQTGQIVSCSGRFLLSLCQASCQRILFTWLELSTENYRNFSQNKQRKLSILIQFKNQAFTPVVVIPNISVFYCIAFNWTRSFCLIESIDNLFDIFRFWNCISIVFCWPPVNFRVYRIFVEIITTEWSCLRNGFRHWSSDNWMIVGRDWIYVPDCWVTAAKI